MESKSAAPKYKTLKSLSEEVLEEMSLAITIVSFNYLFGKRLTSMYSSIVEQKEVDTELLLHLLSGKDKEILISKSNFETLEMIFY
jgi:5-formyltetrahydrofolate cyclo-ligase